MSETLPHSNGAAIPEVSSSADGSEALFREIGNTLDQWDCMPNDTREMCVGLGQAIQKLQLAHLHFVAMGHRLPSNSLDTVAEEVARAKSKHPTWPTDPLHALAVLGEEFGELTKEMLQLTYEPHKSTKETVRAEAIQTAAMALRLVASLDRYEYRRGPQHRQDEPHRVPCAACDRGDFSWGHADDCPQNNQVSNSGQETPK